MESNNVFKRIVCHFQEFIQGWLNILKTKMSSVITNQKEKRGGGVSGDASQQQSTLLAYLKPWIFSPAPQKEKERNTIHYLHRHRKTILTKSKHYNHFLKILAKKVYKQGSLFNFIKDIFKSLIAIIILNSETLNAFLPRLGATQEFLLKPLQYALFYRVC
jgi:hypothetical protein